MIAGIRSGKTLGGAYDSLLQAVERGDASNIGVIIEPTFQMVRQVAERAVREIWPPEIIKDWNRSEFKLTMTTGHEVYFRSATEPERIRGLSRVAWVWMDEAAMMSEETWLIIRGRLADCKAPLLITTTPKFEKGSIWLKAAFDRGIDPEFTDSGVPWERRWWNIEMSSRDNPYMDPDEWDEIEKMYGGDFFLQEVEGKFIDSALLFRPTWIRRYGSEDIKGLRFAHFMTVDPALTEEQRADRDESAICVYGVDPGNRRFIRESWAGQVSTTDLLDLIFAYQGQYNCHVVGFEDVAFQRVLITQLRDMQKDRKQYFVIQPIKRGSRSKVLRAQAAVRPMEQGMLLFPRNSGGEAAIRQLLEFPYGQRDDRVDTIVDIFDPQMVSYMGEYDYKELREDGAQKEVPVLSHKEVNAILGKGGDLPSY